MVVLQAFAEEVMRWLRLPDLGLDKRLEDHKDALQVTQ